MAEEGKEVGIEQQIERAVRFRLQHFKDQADSLTLESVRRLLEKDLGLEKLALDAHKRFIRQYLEKQMDGADGCNPKTATDVDKDVHSSDKEATILPKQNETKKDSKKSCTEDEEMMEDSPIMGVLSPKSEPGTQGSSVSESRIEKAIWERADHFLSNSEKITLVGVRRLLEEDLGLDKNSLDPFKKFISLRIDQVLHSPKGAKSAKDIKKNSERSQSKKSGKISCEEGSDSSAESDKLEDKIKLRKEAAPRKNKKLEEPKKRKRSKDDVDVSSKRQNKLAKRQKEEDNESDDDGRISGQSQSSVEKPVLSKEKSLLGYGKKVEHLKSVIKACGMTVAPLIYKKAKQLPDNKREAFILKELEGILSREGLSKSPSEKEIKDCRKRKETAKELEGIDMSNIISSTRRRSTFSFVAPPKSEMRAKGEKIDVKDNKNKDNNDKDQNDKDQNDGNDEEEDEKVEEEEVDDDDGNDDDDEEGEEDESEEFNEDDNEESD